MKKINKLLIVDLQHSLYRFYKSYKTGFFTVKETALRINQTIEIIKEKENCDFVVIACDTKCQSRNEYFTELFGENDLYKGTRDSNSDEFYVFVRFVTKELTRLQPVVIRINDYEADDIVQALVDIKEIPEKVIMTIDADALPYLDDNVSIMYFKPTLKTRTSIDNYHLIDSYNFEEMIMTFKNLSPKPSYNPNNILLVKLLRGDTSDNIPKVKGMTPTKVDEIVKSHSMFPEYENFKWSYSLEEDEIKKHLKFFLRKDDLVEQALNNFRIMKMNTSLNGRRDVLNITEQNLLDNKFDFELDLQFTT